ncbi:MAG: Crp/Fnr family transcriptional regulator [Acidobacteriaceae bacterium]|nr:Crp/Fnr family transcriptional regulator [Acidobacteriaceae bacterium]
MPTAQRPAIVATLKGNPLFSALDDSEIAAFAGRAMVRSFSAGELLFTEGEPCAGLYVVVSGRVRIFKTSPAGREQILAVEGPGSSIAELPVFDGGAYPASAAATEEAQLVFVSRNDFRACCLEHPDVALKVLQVVGARLRRLVGIIEELSFATVRHRLIAWLLREAQTSGQPSAAGPIFELRLSHQELASHIGTVRELISRNLARLQSQGFIQVKGREITLTSQEELESELASPM